MEFEQSKLPYWIDLKGHLLERALDSYLKRCDDPASLARDWDQKKSERYGLKWLEMSKYQFFEKSLTNWFESKWQEIDQNSQKLEFISEVKDVTKQISSDDYQSVMAKILLNFVAKAYPLLSVNQKWQDELDSTVQ